MILIDLPSYYNDINSILMDIDRSSDVEVDMVLRRILQVKDIDSMDHCMTGNFSINKWGLNGSY